MSKLQKLMEERGMTPTDIGRALGKQNQGGNIIKIAKGEKKLYDASYETIQSLAGLFNVPIEELLEDTEADGTIWKLKSVRRIIAIMVKNYKSIEDGLYYKLRKSNGIPSLIWGKDGEDEGEIGCIAFSKFSTLVLRARYYTENGRPYVKFYMGRINEEIGGSSELENTCSHFDLPKFNPYKTNTKNYIADNSQSMVKQMIKKEPSEFELEEIGPYDFFAEFHKFTYNIK